MLKRWGLAAAAGLFGLGVMVAASACGGDSNSGGKTATAPAAVASTAPSAAAATREISITGAWARNATMMSPTPAAGMATPAMGATASASMVAGPRGAAYMVIKNTGTVDDALIGAESTVAMATEVHETVMSGETATMRPAPRVELKAGATLELKPGSYHIMFMGLKQQLETGTTFSITLKFEKAGSIPVTVEVRAQ